MLKSLIGSGTVSGALREGMTVSARRAQDTADRIANAWNGPGFDAALDAAQQGRAVDVEAEMVALADEQLRFEATTRLLQKVYQQVRSSVKER